MQLLTVLTLIYAAVLVLALAVSLIVIIYYLWRIGTVLAETEEALGQVEAATAPLAEYLTPLNDRVGEMAAAISDARDQVAERPPKARTLPMARIYE